MEDVAFYDDSVSRGNFYDVVTYGVYGISFPYNVNFNFLMPVPRNVIKKVFVGLDKINRERIVAVNSR